MHCPQKYVGQTGRNFHTRYKEHTQEIRNKIAIRDIRHGTRIREHNVYYGHYNIREKRKTLKHITRYRIYKVLHLTDYI
jgi:hypothetical protein